MVCSIADARALIMGKVGHIPLEVRVEYGHRLHQLPHLGTDALVHELLHLGADLRSIDVGIFTKELGAYI